MNTTQTDPIAFTNAAHDMTVSLLGSVGNIIGLVIVVGIVLIALPALRGLASNR